VWRNDQNGYGTYSGFGEDEAGNLYVANTLIDTVYRFHSDQVAVTHTVTPDAGAHGSLTPATPQTVNDGETIAFTVQSEAGYAIGDVTGCGGTLVGETFTTAPVTGDCTVAAVFVVGDRLFTDGFPSPACGRQNGRIAVLHGGAEGG